MQNMFLSQRQEQTWEHKTFVPSSPHQTMNASQWWEAAQYYENAGCISQAAMLFANYSKVYPQSPEARLASLKAGQLFRQQNKPFLALQYLNPILEKPPAGTTRADILFEIALVHEVDGKFLVAKSTYGKITPVSARVVTRLGWLHCQQPSAKNRELGLAYLRQAIELDPGHLDAWIMLARVLATEGQTAKALEAVSQGMEIDCGSPLLWAQLGALYFGTGQLQDSFVAFSRSHDRCCVGETLFSLGLLYERCGQLSEARNMYKQAHETCTHPLVTRRYKVAFKSAGKLEADLATQKPILVDLTNPSHHVREKHLPPVAVAPGCVDLQIALV